MPLQKNLVSFLFLLMLTCHASNRHTSSKRKQATKEKSRYIICSLRRFSSSCNERKQSRKILGWGALGRHSSSAQASGIRDHGAIASCTSNIRPCLETRASLAACKRPRLVRLVCSGCKVVCSMQKDPDAKRDLSDLCFSAQEFRVSITNMRSSWSYGKALIVL